jgi:hypothetical protein
MPQPHIVNETFGPLLAFAQIPKGASVARAGEFSMG